MLSELARDDIPMFDRLMGIRPVEMGRVDRRLVGVDGPMSVDDTIGGYCFEVNIPHQIVASRMVRHTILA